MKRAYSERIKPTKPFRAGVADCGADIGASISTVAA